MLINMPIVKCKQCKKEFFAKPSWLKIGYGKFCSSKCQYEAAKKGKFIACDICGEKTWKQPKQIKHSKSGKFFCSKSCQTLWRNRMYVGKNHPNWKNAGSRYRELLIKSRREEICVLCKTEDKRILLAHHLDGNRKNAKVKNLIWLCHNCHFLVHHFLEEKNRLN